MLPQRIPLSFFDDVIYFLSNDQSTDALKVSVASAHIENLLYNAIVIDGHINELRAGGLGFGGGVGHRGIGQGVFTLINNIIVI